MTPRERMAKLLSRAHADDALESAMTILRGAVEEEAKLHRGSHVCMCFDRGRQVEREACAKVAEEARSEDELVSTFKDCPGPHGKDIASAIRTRGEGEVG